MSAVYWANIWRAIKLDRWKILSETNTSKSHPAPIVWFKLLFGKPAIVFWLVRCGETDVEISNYSWQRKALARPFLVPLHFAERDSPAHNWSCGLLQKSMSLATQSGLPFSLSWMRTTWRKATRHTLNKAQDTANNGKASTARIRKSKPSSSSSTLAAKAGVGIEAAAKPAAITAPWACCISLRATACGLGRKALLSCPTKHATAASSRREAKRDRAIAFAEHVGFRRTHCGLDQLRPNVSTSSHHATCDKQWFNLT